MSSGSNKRHPRHDFRAMSHEKAHADSTKLAEIPHHPLVCREEPQLVDDQASLNEWIAYLRNEGVFAYDSEFIGELSYYPKLCLIQVATASRIGLIDAIADIDLTGFWELLADKSVLKLVHAAEQDVEPVARLLGRPAENVFDTQIASGFAGLSYPSGLSKLVKEILGFQIGKGFTFTHWDQRPLTPVQLRYAADDVRYIPAMYDIIKGKLEQSGSWKWALEESAELCKISRHAFNYEKDYLRLRGAGSLTPRQMAILRELYQWRDQAAQRKNLPPRTFLKDEILIDLSRKPIKVAQELTQVKGLPLPVERSESQAIIDATQKGLGMPESLLPKGTHIEETSAQRFAADGLMAMIQAWCFGQGVDPSLVCSRQELGRWLREYQKNPQPQGFLFEGWRGELLGKRLQGFLSGETFQTSCPNGIVKTH